MDRRKGDSLSFEGLEPEGILLCLQSVGQDPDQLISVLDTIPVGLVQWVVGKRVELEDLAEGSELTIVSGTDHDVRVTCLEDLVGHN